MSTPPVSQALKTAREWWMAIVAAAALVGVLVLFVLLIPALGRISKQAKSGNEARARQCRIFPVSRKGYVDQYQRGVITRADLATADVPPKNCPPRHK